MIKDCFYIHTVLLVIFLVDSLTSNLADFLVDYFRVSKSKGIFLGGSFCLDFVSLFPPHLLKITDFFYNFIIFFKKGEHYYYCSKDRQKALFSAHFTDKVS